MIPLALTPCRLTIMFRLFLRAFRDVLSRYNRVMAGGGRTVLADSRPVSQGTSGTHWGVLSVGLALSLTVSGCVTSLGYFPENLKVRQLADQRQLVPSYVEVKTWAYDVQDGLDTRATLNHYAAQFGAVFGLAAAGTMAGLAIFDPGSAALKGIPIGAAFLSGAAVIYDNNYRHDMYSRASAYVRRLIDLSDQRIKFLASKPTDDDEAICLKQAVDNVLELVRKHVTRMDPNNLVAELRAIKPGVDQDKLADLLKAAQGDLSDLDIPKDLQTTYCSKAARVTNMAALEDAPTIIETTQTALASFIKSTETLKLELSLAPADYVSGLKTRGQALKAKNSDQGQAALDKIAILETLISSANRTLTEIKNVMPEDAAPDINTISGSSQDRQEIIRAGARLIAMRERAKVLDDAATKAVGEIRSAAADAEAALQPKQ